MVDPRAAALLFGVFATGCLFPEYTFDEVGGAGGGGQNTGATGGTATTGGQGGLGGQGGAPPTEDCFSAGDEDDDGLADCADPDCNADVECVAAIPVGWGTLGYVALWSGLPGDDPACPPGTMPTDYAGHTGLQNTTPSCSACGCGSPSWASCELTDHASGTAGLQGLFTRNVACANGSATAIGEVTVPSSWDGTCSDLNTLDGNTCSSPPCNLSIQSMAAVPVNGSCTGTGGVPNGGTPTWTTDTKACEAPKTLQGCDVGQACLPRPQAPFESRVCVAKAGDQTCPSGFTDKTVTAGDFTDTRDCTPCTCGGATGGTCKITTSIYVTNDCSSGLATTVESGQCKDLVMNPTVAGRSSSITTPPTGGSCSSTGGGAPTGSVTSSDPMTFCCLPH